jgi:hypothetical protein
MVGLLVSPFAQNTNSRKLHPYQGKIRSKKGAYKSLGNSQRKKEGGGEKNKTGITHRRGEIQKKKKKNTAKTKQQNEYWPCHWPSSLQSSLQKKKNPKHQFP